MVKPYVSLERVKEDYVYTSISGGYESKSVINAFHSNHIAYVPETT
jgi:hypothetical protein